ncbi:MAG: T9SS C-terminal target domain-containing protein [Candidatus Neomarinimicrobiota bacterium]|nr:MAG: T9SS C-terminal target domain-containing protein [Candidatus Neomarinimicrobiota bacterium]
MKKSLLTTVLVLTGFLSAQTVDFDTQIQPIFNSNCTSCHGTNGNGGLNLTTGNSYNNLVDVVSQGYAPALRVASGDPNASVLWNKINNTGTYGGQMPPSGGLSQSNIDLITTWITELATTTPIHDIQYTTTLGSGCYDSPELGNTVTVSGKITATNGSNKYYLQDGGTDWDGIYIYDSGVTMAQGDSVTLTATVSEYYGFTELGSVTDLTIHSSGNALWDPIPITTGALNGGCSDTGEPYEGLLVTLTNVTVTQAANSYGEWYVDDGTGECQIDDAFFSVTPAVGDFFDSITGVVDYSFSQYAVNPRSADDIVTSAIGPTLVSLDFAPAAPLPNEDVNVTVVAFDDKPGLTVDLYVSFDGGAFTANGMTDNGDSTYSYTIPGQAEGTTAAFYAILTDSDANADTSATFSVTFATPSNITPIASIQDTTGTGSDASALDGQVVTISGIVTAEFWGSSGNHFIFVQDAPGPWNGIMVYSSGGWDTFDFSTPAGTVHSVAEGDSVTITGTVSEYYGMTELGDVTAFTIHGPAQNMIPAELVSSGEVATGGPQAEAYESCLITVHDVTVDNPDLGFGEWSVNDGTGSLRVDDKWDYFYHPKEGQILTSVTGCLDYSYSNTKLQPRLARDVVESGDVRLQRIQQVLYSDLLKAGFDTESDTSYMRGDTVTVYGVVTMPTGLSFAGAGVKFIFQDTLGGPWSSILSYDPDSTAFPVLYEGDVIRATGYVSEYRTSGSNMTELFITQPIDLLDFGQPQPTVPVVNTGDLRWPTEAEQWGTVMVRAENAVVTANDLPYGEWAIDDGTGSVHVDDDSDSLNAWQNANGRPPVGSYITSIEGWIYHHYGSYSDSTAYKLEPLYPSDIVFGAGPPNIKSVERDPCVPGPNDAVTVTAQIEDNSAIASALIVYTTDGVNYSTVSMANTDSTAWVGDIPATGAEGAHVDYFIEATDDGVDQASAKTSTLPGDTTALQFGYVTNSTGLTIADVQMTSWPVGDSPFNGCVVTLSGIVTGDTAQANSGYHAYAMQSAEGPWNGIIFDPPSGVTLTRGDSITVTGTVEEYDPAWHFKWDNNTKLVDVTDVTVHSSGHYIGGISVGTSDLAQDADEVESYEGVVVTLHNVTVSSVNQYDWSVDDGSGITCLIDDDMANAEADAFLGALQVGSTLETVSGIFNFSFGTYKIQVRDMADLGQLGVNDDYVPAPLTYALHPNYPNPFNPETRIRFDLGGNEQVKLIIYNVLGYQVRTLINDQYGPGMHVVNWDGRDNEGNPVSSGVYIYRLKAGSFMAERKMLLIR